MLLPIEKQKNILQYNKKVTRRKIYLFVFDAKHTFCGGTLKAFGLKSTVFLRSIHGSTRTNPVKLKLVILLCLFN